MFLNDSKNIRSNIYFDVNMHFKSIEKYYKSPSIKAGFETTRKSGLLHLVDHFLQKLNFIVGTATSNRLTKYSIGDLSISHQF